MYIRGKGHPLEGLRVSCKHLHPRRHARAAIACRAAVGVKHAQHAMLAGLVATCMVRSPHREQNVVTDILLSCLARTSHFSQKDVMAEAVRNPASEICVALQTVSPTYADAAISVTGEQSQKYREELEQLIKARMRPGERALPELKSSPAVRTHMAPCNDDYLGRILCFWLLNFLQNLNSPRNLLPGL